MKKKGNLLAQNLVFFILTLVFLTILIAFLFSKTSSTAELEEKYAKQIALLIDSAEPTMAIHLDMKDAIEEAQKEGLNPENIVKINENIVTVQLKKEGGYSYSFFNSIDVSENLNMENKEYYFVINEK